jgi:hypothetical protein
MAVPGGEVVVSVTLVFSDRLLATQDKRPVWRAIGD